MTLNTLGDFKGNSWGNAGDREFNYDTCGKVVGWERRSDFQGQLKFVLRELIYEGVDPEWSLIVSIDAIVHD